MSGSVAPRRIELLETLGRGGFGAVYLADVHGRDDFVQRLAVKVLSVEMSNDPDIAARQRDEARLLARLNHDHIVRVIDLTELDGRPAVLMEYVEGVDASVLMGDGPIPVKAALQIAAAASSALDAAWSSPDPRTGQPLRVIHRDIKPANLLVSRHGGLKVLDFGIARGEFDREGKTGSVQFGTARFMAPEQWLYGTCNNKVDIYALGVTLVEMLSGLNMNRAPLDQDAFASHVAAVRDAVCRPVDPDAHRSTWPPRLIAGIDQVLGAMLRFDPDDRPDAGQLFDTLVALVDDAPGPGLRRWARKLVPPHVTKQRARWAQVPPPTMDETGGGLAPVELVEIGDGTGGALSRRAATPASAPHTGVLTPSHRVEASRGASRPDPSSTGSNTLAVGMPVPQIEGRLASHRSLLVAGLAAAVAIGVIGVGGIGLSHLFFDGDSVPSQDDATTLRDKGAADDQGVRAPANLDATGVSQPAAAPAADPALAPASPPPSAMPHTRSATTSTPHGAPPAQPAPAPSTAAQPAAAQPAEASTPAVAEATSTDDEAPTSSAVTLSSTPWDAQVSIDGHVVGRTPLHSYLLPDGKHTVTMTRDGSTITQSIDVGGRNPTMHIWTIATNDWRSSR